MKPSQVLPLVLMLIDITAGFVYLVVDGDIRRFIYWLAAATLTATVTF